MGYFIGTYNPRPVTPTSTTPLHRAPQPEHKTSIQNMEAAWSDLKGIVGLDNISTSEDDRRAHAGTDWSSYQAVDLDIPFAVVRPATTQEVSEVVKICHERKIPMTAYSGGTSLEGHFSQQRGGICIDFSRMDKIVQLNKEDLDVVVQPAVGWQDLNEELAKDDLFFPPDPGPGAMIGGMVGTGCSGTNAYRFGTMKDWVLSLTVVLADGTIIKTRQRPRKSSAGYDLTRLFIGSEGTLGLVTEATLKVTVKPKHQRVAVCSFKSIYDAAACVRSVVGAGVPILAIEILDDKQMKYLNASGLAGKNWAEAPTLFFKFGGATASGVKDDIKMVQQLAKSQGSQSFEFARNEEEAADLWQARKEILWSVFAMKRAPTDKVWTTDVAVPISRLPQIIDETRTDIDSAGLIGSIVGHVGDGNFHSK
jgi:D-lactate dehydrogenase (cytochrome)